ncbi:MAG TPA: hypothetical protein GX513_12175, partial [Firmicutes bacterium]|nr:hypothetical protein [Bacillota bacterium]
MRAHVIGEDTGRLSDSLEADILIEDMPELARLRLLFPQASKDLPAGFFQGTLVVDDPVGPAHLLLQGHL